MIGMIPEGLILLTSVVFAVSVIRLSKYKTLVQDLYCTDRSRASMSSASIRPARSPRGTMRVDEIIPLEGCLPQKAEMAEALTALVGALSDEDNPTYNAVKAQFSGETLWRAGAVVRFPRRASGQRGFLRARHLCDGRRQIYPARALMRSAHRTEAAYAARAKRVLLLARADGVFAEDKSLPADVRPVGLIAISDKIRAEGAADAPLLCRAGRDAEGYFGRQCRDRLEYRAEGPVWRTPKITVTPPRCKPRRTSARRSSGTRCLAASPAAERSLSKRSRRDGHTVVMTGDSVNDVLALKEADCSIAMASGSDAARTVFKSHAARLQLASMPQVVKEGRRSINNLQRSASCSCKKQFTRSFSACSLSYCPPPIPLSRSTSHLCRRADDRRAVVHSGA